MSWTEWTDSSFRGLNLKKLKVDQAYFNVSNNFNKPFYLYTLSDECVKCPFRKLKDILPNKDTIIKLDVSRSFELRLFDKKDLGPYVFPNETSDGLRWSMKPDMGEFGVYDLKIMNSTGVMKYDVAKDPVNVQTCK